MKKSLITLGMILVSLHAYAMEGVIPNTTDVKQKKETVSIVTVDSINERRSELSKLAKDLLELITEKSNTEIVQMVNDMIEFAEISSDADINNVIKSTESIHALATITIYHIRLTKPMQEFEKIVEQMHDTIYSVPLAIKSELREIGWKPAKTAADLTKLTEQAHEIAPTIDNMMKMSKTLQSISDVSLKINNYLYELKKSGIAKI